MNCANGSSVAPFENWATAIGPFSPCGRISNSTECPVSVAAILSVSKETSHSDKDLLVERIGHGQIPRCVAMDCHLTLLA